MNGCVKLFGDGMQVCAFSLRRRKFVPRSPHKPEVSVFNPHAINLQSNPHMSCKNGFAIFSGEVAVGSKGGVMVHVAVWDVTVAVWADAASIGAVAAFMWVVASSMSDVTASMHDAQVLCGILHPLFGLLQAPCGPL